MGDLISRSELLKFIDVEAKQIPIDAEKHHIDTNVIDGMKASLKAITNIIKEQPTAYDVEKVVEQLREHDGWCIGCHRKDECNECSIGEAIEIVKQGGIGNDDVCEWKYNGDEYLWETSCGNLHIFMSDGPNENKYQYCPYCGKEILARSDS